MRIDAVEAPEAPAEPAPAGEIRRRLLRRRSRAEHRLRTLPDAGIA
ncbi:hypothetical protein [Streptomyces sp. NPDC003032]